MEGPLCYCPEQQYHKNSNAIMVLDQGEIIERGNHKSLIDQREPIINFIGAIEMHKKGLSHKGALFIKNHLIELD